MGPCPVCNSHDTSVRSGWNPLLEAPIAECTRCQLTFTAAPRELIRAKLRELYAHKYWHVTDDTPLTRRLLASGPHGSALRAWIIHRLRSAGVPSSKVIAHERIIRSHTSGRRLLEVGCGQGYALRYLAKRRYDVSGIEPDGRNCERINRRMGRNVCQQGDAETFPFDGPFDVVYLSHVFEHLVDPIGFLKRAQQVLTDEGIVLVEVPNCANLDARSSSLADFSHLYHFTPVGLERCIVSAAFTLVDLRISRTQSRSSYRLLKRQLFGQLDDEEVPAELGHRLIAVARPTSSTAH